MTPPGCHQTARVGYDQKWSVGNREVVFGDDRLLAVSAESVALIPKCAECEAAWLQADEGRWRAYLGGDNLDEPAEPAELVFYCARSARSGSSATTSADTTGSGARRRPSLT